MSKVVIVVTAILLISGCTPTDPSLKDLKSPCVALSNHYRSDDTVHQLNPCIRRSPRDNYIA